MLSRNKKILVLCLMGMTLWLSRYLLSPHFGFYEDDYSRIPFAIQVSGDKIVERAFSFQSLAEGHGLPLHGPFIILMSFVGWHIGGLQGLYILGFVFVFLNAVLFYLLMLRIWKPDFASLAAISYCLFSADTTQAYLTHAFGLQPALLFLLLAVHAYLARRKLAAYLLATCILFVYETPYLLMLVLPFFEIHHDSKRKGKSEFIRHTAIIAGIFFSIVSVRYFLGEGRVGDLELLSSVKVSILHMIEGPVVSVGTYFLRAWQVIDQIDLEILTLVLLGFVIYLLFLWKHPYDPEPRLRHDASLLSAQEATDKFGNLTSIIRHPWAHPVLIGFLLLVLAYPLTFTVRAYAISGRDTRVHFAGVLGAAILFACILSQLAHWIDGAAKRKLGPIVLAGWLAMLLGFGLLVQRDYRASWDNQKSFWSQVIQEAPDLDRGTVILVDGGGLSETSYIGSNTWNLPRILEQMYSFPEAWENYDIPRVYRLTPDWDVNILGEERVLHLNARTTIAPRSYDRAVDPAKVIFFESVNNQLSRIARQLSIRGTDLPVKTLPTPQSTRFEPTLIYSLLVNDASSN